MEKPKRWTLRRPQLGFLAIVGLLTWLPQTAWAGDPPAKVAYVKYCGACHGAGGKGDGIASGFLRPKPTDLTQIAKKHGGDFPFVLVMQSIDGTKSIGAHGNGDMPVWGEVFKDDINAGFERRARIQGRLMLITDYIRSIQEK